MALRDLIPWRKTRQEDDEHGTPAPLRREFARMMDDFLSSRWALPEFLSGGYVPRVDVSETDKDIRVRAELPGMTREDIEITLHRDQLVLKGEKKESRTDEGRNFVRTECSYGCFSRMIPLPCKVMEDKVDAVFKNGVLTVTLPKAEEPPKGKIEIKAE